MFIKKIRLKNGYKRFHDLTIDLGENPARIVALVGPNGCGKSSVLDGLLYHASARQRIGGGIARDVSYHSMTGVGSLTWQDVEIQFTAGNFSEIRALKEKTGKANTIFSFRSPYRYNSLLKITETKAVSEIWKNSYGAGDASSLDAKMEDNYRRLYSVYNLYRDENDLKPSEAKAKIIGDLNTSIKKCLDLEISNLGNVEGNQGTLYFRKPDHPKEFEFNVLSSGEKEVVDLLLDLYLRKEDYSDTVFLIDEPELHINTAIQGNLLEEIDRLIGPDCQIWLTTHSIGFLRALQTKMKDKCQIIQFRSEYNLAAEAHTLTPVKVGPGTWRDLFAIALDDLAHLVSPSTIIYCEGRAEPGSGGREQGMDARVFNRIFAESHPDALFTSSGGNTEPDQRSAIALLVLSKVFPKVDIWVLKDRDMASGKPTDENDRRVYLNTNPDNHRVLKRWEIENYLYDKEVLKAYCAGKGLQFDEAAYDAFVTNIDDQNLKDETQRIKNFCGIKSSINAEVFKIALSDYIISSMVVFKELEECIFSRQ
ncbi:AAA family ATPase [Asticcacaulis machinosus]|uniref:AAA family ATPase n=1 Tax=Asticcacaulis machinosus TaxID=2984211 RepID=A0ABT5HIA0_9CAUL|nr:AAA family ATPase [Asticcacaulis machinosus]MDC7675977.1 AAA family ATPase [Asticcacaulis machinosus]